MCDFTVKISSKGHRYLVYIILKQMIWEPDMGPFPIHTGYIGL